MNAQEIKEKIYEEERVEDVLSELGCHHIRRHTGFWTCGNPDGDNQSAIVIYENENLTTLNYTRQLTKQARTTDLFDLVMYIKQCTFPESLKEICNMLGYDYYQEPEDVPDSLQIIKMLGQMNSDSETEDETPLKPIPEEILSYYIQLPNAMFKADNISFRIQKEFGIGYDPYSNRITIPLLDPLGSLCGVKGRLLGEPDEYNPKYLYIEKCAKSYLLYGYYENREYIKQSNTIYCVESEKGVLQLASYGYRNAVATGGKHISKTQAELLVRTGKNICIALDKDVGKEEIEIIASVFPENIPVYYVYDYGDILGEKESPSDNLGNWMELIKNNIYKLERRKD